MAKRKKPATKVAVTTRRTSRRGKQANADVAADGETSASVEPAPEEVPAEDQPSTSGSNSTATEDQSQAEQQKSDLAITKPCQVPVVALHKKFGKYRCLFNNDENFIRKYEVGSDSETNSSVEIRVVDPCASSESDSNTALDTQSDTNSGACGSPMNSTISALQSQTNSRDISPVPMLSEVPLDSDVPLLDNHELKEKLELETPELVPDINIDEQSMNKSLPSAESDHVTTEMLEVNHNIESEENARPQELSLVEEQLDQIEFAGDDDEVITIVQIVEDDHPELYYNIKIDSPKDLQGDESDSQKQETEIQRHFQSLNLTSSIESNSMDCSDLPNSCTTSCGTPDLPFPKENLEVLVRPDPSLTPSSTLSDDSNSSRATDQNQINSNDSAESSPTGVRRSSRIKTISNLKQKTKGYGLVKTPLKKALITQTKLKLEELGSDSQERPTELMNNSPNSPSFPVPSDMPVKVKSRWRRSSELEMGANSPANSPLASPNPLQRLTPLTEVNPEPEASPLSKEAYDKIIDDRMRQYQHLEENEYLCDRMISKETKKMTCDCFMTKEELERGELACGEDCLNRLLMIECNSRCPVGDRCTNRRFQKRENAMLKVFYADKKGCGVEADVDIPTGEFLMEYVGEVLDYDQFYKRAQTYSDENNAHHYFMSLKGDTVIDATMKGNISRFINHSCDPNAETQKWTVNGELRIGFFSKRDIPSGEEITFDYQFQRFGKVAQRCYCGAANCRGWIGAEPDSDDEDYEEEEDVSTSKSSIAGEEETQEGAGEEKRPRARKPRKYKPSAPDLVQDADIEEDLEVLNRTGVKNQSHTLRLSRAVVRAKRRAAQTALLRLLRDAHLPCRRLFLDYRGLRLLAPWCTDAPLPFRLEMLQTVDRLPITNKTMVQESRFFTIVERWLSAADVPAESGFIDEATGLPVELPNSTEQGNAAPEKSKENTAILEKIKDLSKQLLERWSSLKEVFKIPKKERIQQMKEHERQANVERRAADSSGSRDRDRREDRERDKDRDRDRDRERERDRDRDRERDRDKERSDRDRDRDRDRYRDRDRDDRDRRKRRSSPDGRRSIRLNDRVCAGAAPVSKEERRRAFAEAAAAADAARWTPYWTQPESTGMFPGGMMGPMGPMGGPMMEGVGEFGAPPPFCHPFPGAQPFCMPHNMMGMGGFGMGGFMFGQGLGGPPPFVQPPPVMDTTQHHTVPPQMVVAEQPVSEPVGEVRLPSMWRSAQDGRGRTYYYHVKLRQPQWEPPPPPDDSSSEEEEEEPMSAIDTAIVRRQVKGKLVEGVNGIYEVIKEDTHNGLIPDHALITMKPRKRRPGLVSERPISPRTEEDKLAGRLEVKRYKQTKEKLRRRRERLVARVRLLKESRHDLKMVDLADTDTESEGDSDDGVEKPFRLPDSPPPGDSPQAEADAEAEAETGAEAARRIKEHFRSAMARVMVHHLNPYRHKHAPVGRITSTADFKHLARKLTHFVMLKELKQCRTVEELVVTDSVRSKAKMFVRKYMAKFGPVYNRPPEEAD